MKKRTTKPKGYGRVTVERTQPNLEPISFPAVKPGTFTHLFVGGRWVELYPPLARRTLVAPEHRALSWGALAPGVKP